MELSKLLLTDRVAIVTGGGGGIGSAIALTFANAGAHVVTIDRAAEPNEKVAAEVRARGKKALAIPADCGAGEQVNRAVDRVVKELGHIDVLVCCAGGARHLPLLEISEEDWDEQQTRNLRTFFLCSQAVARVMVRQGKGSIMTVNAGDRPRIPWHILYGIGCYMSAMAAIAGLVEAMAAEWGRYGIRVNGISPKFIDTPRTIAQYSFKSDRMEREATIKTVPLGRYGVPDDVAGAALFLASDASDFVTGEVIRVDGGPVL